MSELASVDNLSAVLSNAAGQSQVEGVAQTDSRHTVGVRGSRPTSAATPLLLLAQGIAPGATTDVPGRSAGSPAPDSPDNVSDAATSGWFGWGIPPIRWGGYMITDIRADKTGAQPRRLQRNEIANIKGSSYIWQPWFAAVSGSVGLATSKEYKSRSLSSAVSQQQTTSSKAVSGNGDVTLFPVSRFPFNAYFDVSDSRASGEPSTSDITNTRFGLRQTYRPQEGNSNYAASFNRSTLESSSFGRDTVNALAASMNRSVDSQTFEIAGSHTGNTRSNTGESTALNNLLARHSYRPEPELAVESLASLSSSDFHLFSAGKSSDNRSRFAQANTFVTWRPEEDSPLFVTGGGRFFQSSIANNAGQADSYTLSGNFAATYALTRQTRFSGSVTATQLLSDTANRLLTTQTAGLNHVGDPVGISGFAYTWNAGANVANQTGLVEGSRQNVNGQLGHNLTRNLTLSENSQLSFGLGQNVGAAFDTVTSNTQTLGHNGNVSWRVSRDSATSAFVSLMGSDSRTSGTNANHFQLINFQANGQLQFSRSSFVAMNLTVQGVRQSTATTAITPINFNSNGNLSYSHLRAFDVPRLRYTALYTINDSQFKTRLQGDVNASRERIRQSFEQRLDYNVGRVTMRLSMRVADIEGRRDALIFFRLSREFGGF